MKIQSATFLKSCRGVATLPNDYPQIAFCGRSNCGKSTLLNVLTGKRGLARVSRTPGRTQTINLFRINKRFDFVDLPGFGFAKAPGKVQRELGAMITGYVRDAPLLRGMVFLLDIRHKPSVLDCIMEQLLREAELPTLHVATKADKIGTTKQARHLKLIRETLELDREAPLLAISALAGKGTRPLLRAIEEHFLEQPAETAEPQPLFPAADEQDR